MTLIRISATSTCALLLFATSNYAQTMTAPISLPLDAGRSVASSVATKARTADNTAIRPFTFNVPEERLAELKRRIAATPWPQKETVAGQSQGVPLATMKELARYWATDYDWRKVEAKLKALPQFVTNIDGLDNHFIQVP